MISSETTKVYRGGNRRWLSAKSAANAEARARIRDRCECDPGESASEGYMGSPGETCRLHDEKYYPRIRARLAGFYLRKFRMEAQP